MDVPRSGAPRTIGDAAVERLVALTPEEAPRNATPCSTRAMARRTGMSQSAVSRLWRAFGARPHRAETFKLPSDPACGAQMRDMVGLYPAPPDRALVRRVDETPSIQAAQGTAPALSGRRTHDDRRHGTLDPVAALDVRAGTVIGTRERRHRGVEFRASRDRVERGVPPSLAAHLVLDNPKAPKTRLIRDRLAGARAAVRTSRPPRPRGSTRSRAGSRS